MLGRMAAAVGKVPDAPLRVQHAHAFPEVHVEGADRQDAVRVDAAQEALGQIVRCGVEGQRRLEAVGVPGMQAVGGAPADAAGLRVPDLHAQVRHPVDEVLDLHAGEGAPVAGAQGAQDHQVELRAVDAQVERMPGRSGLAGTGMRARRARGWLAINVARPSSGEPVPAHRVVQHLDPQAGRVADGQHAVLLHPGVGDQLVLHRRFRAV